MPLRFLTLVGLSSILFACGSRAVDTGNAEAETRGFVLPGGECVVAKSRNGCCVSFVPATRQEVKNDPCLSAPGVAVDDNSGCELPRSCIVQCPPQRPPSRAAVMRDGACVFADECAEDADCLVADNCYDCCCADAISEKIAKIDPCLVTEDEDVSECKISCAGTCDTSGVARCAPVLAPHGEMINACVFAGGGRP